MKFSWPLAAVLLMACPVAALDADLTGAGSLVLEASEALGSHVLATGPWVGDVLPTVTVEGAITRQVWQVDSPGRTTLQLLAPLRAQIEDEGFRTLLDCEAKVCGGFDFRAALEVLPPPEMFVDLVDYRYLSAERPGEAVSILVSRSDERGFVQIVRVVPAPIEAASVRPPDPVQPPADVAAPPGNLASRIEGEGRVVLEGVAFASGSADLAPGGEEALRALASYLSANPDRRVALVGHTDAQGSLEANIALSKRRAQAVVDRLVKAHGIPRSQLTAEGMGWLAPRSTNLTLEGREANRRVEAIVLP